jgi:hypothetical protein
MRLLQISQSLPQLGGSIPLQISHIAAPQQQITSDISEVLLVTVIGLLLCDGGLYGGLSLPFVLNIRNLAFWQFIHALCMLLQLHMLPGIFSPIFPCLQCRQIVQLLHLLSGEILILFIIFIIFIIKYGRHLFINIC